MVQATFEVLASGVQTTVQDGGRVGWRAVGVPGSGALDGWALRAANSLVGNSLEAAVLEVLLTGLQLRVLCATTIALAGADLGATVDGQALPMYAPWELAQGQILMFMKRHWGARTYLAVRGGIAVAPMLGSRSTYLSGGWGGFDGRALVTGDMLLVDMPNELGQPAPWLPPEHRPPYTAWPVLRCLPGPHLHLFDPGVPTTLVTATYTVSSQSNRMGYRLHGPGLAVPSVNLPSLGVLPGVVQVPPDQQPILLMADAQTTGGYPIVAVVASADLPLAAQLVPGDQLRLRWVSPQAAHAALLAQAQSLAVSSLFDVHGVPI